MGIRFNKISLGLAFSTLWSLGVAPAAADLGSECTRCHTIRAEASTAQTECRMLDWSAFSIECQLLSRCVADYSLLDSHFRQVVHACVKMGYMADPFASYLPVIAPSAPVAPAAPAAEVAAPAAEDIRYSSGLNFNDSSIASGSAGSTECALLRDAHADIADRMLTNALRVRDLWVEYFPGCDPNAVDINRINIYDPCFKNSRQVSGPTTVPEPCKKLMQSAAPPEAPAAPPATPPTVAPAPAPEPTAVPSPAPAPEPITMPLPAPAPAPAPAPSIYPPIMPTMYMMTIP